MGKRSWLGSAVRVNDNGIAVDPAALRSIMDPKHYLYDRRDEFRYSMKTLNLGFGYQHRPNLGFTLDASNVLNEPQRWYNGYKDRMYRTTINFVTVTIGMNGRF